jgi:hypothetical protein
MEPATSSYHCIPDLEEKKTDEYIKSKTSKNINVQG